MKDQYQTLVPMVVEQTNPGREGIRYLFPTLKGEVIFITGPINILIFLI